MRERERDSLVPPTRNIAKPPPPSLSLSLSVSLSLQGERRISATWRGGRDGDEMARETGKKFKFVGGGGGGKK